MSGRARDMITTEDCGHLQLDSVHMKTNTNAEVELHGEPGREKAVLRSTKDIIQKDFSKKLSKGVKSIL